MRNIINNTELTNEIARNLGAESRENFTELCLSYDALSRYLAVLPENIELTSYLTHDLNELSEIFDPKYVQISLIESLIFECYYSSFYKIKRSCSNIDRLIIDNDYYTSVVLLRLLFEEVVYFNCFVFDIKKTLGDLFRTIEGNLKSKDALDAHYVHSQLFKIYDYLDKFYFQSRLDWKTFRFGDAAWEDISGETVPTTRESTNILTYLKKIEKKAPYPFTKYYDLLCEFSHPNLGSRLMLLKTRTDDKKNPKLVSTVTLGNTDNNESMFWFFDTFAEPMNKTVILALNTINEADRQLEMFKSLGAYRI